MLGKFKFTCIYTNKDFQSHSPPPPNIPKGPIQQMSKAQTQWNRLKPHVKGVDLSPRGPTTNLPKIEGVFNHLPGHLKSLLDSKHRKKC